jgi:hypothetical protein
MWTRSREKANRNEPEGAIAPKDMPPWTYFLQQPYLPKLTQSPNIVPQPVGDIFKSTH